MSQLQIGQVAPTFKLQDGDGHQVSLDDFRDRKTIVYFYPKAATPGCTTEACDFRDNINSMGAAGYQVIGISPDAPEDIKAFAVQERLTFPLLSDPGSQIAKAYGSYGTKTINGKTIEGTLRSTFVLDGDHTVQHAEYNVDAEGHVARLRDTLGI